MQHRIDPHCDREARHEIDDEGEGVVPQVGPDERHDLAPREAFGEAVPKSRARQGGREVHGSEDGDDENHEVEQQHAQSAQGGKERLGAAVHASRAAHGHEGHHQHAAERAHDQSEPETVDSVHAEEAQSVVEDPAQVVPLGEGLALTGGDVLPGASPVPQQEGDAHEDRGEEREQTPDEDLGQPRPGLP